MAVAIGGNGSVTGLGPFSYINDAGNANINRPQFMAAATWGSYSHNFNAVSSGSYTSTSGNMTFPAYNTVSGGNTTGFNASSTPGNCYYDIPLTGFYMFSFENLIDSTMDGHTDSCFNVTDTATNTYRNSPPWTYSYIGDSATSYGAVGFTRDQPAGGQSSIYGSYGVTVVGRFYVGQRIRACIAVGPNIGAKSIYQSNHNFFHGVYLGK